LRETRSNEVLMGIYDIIRQRLARVNIFDTETNDEHVKTNEILSTRVYIIVVIIVLFLFSLNASLESELNMITITTPTLEQYEQFQSEYSDSLECPCEYLSIPYEEFVNILPEYNEICSSDFVTQKWIDYLAYKNTSYFFQLDFRHSASSKFQILRTLCEQAQQTIDENLEQFHSSQFINNQLLSTIIFDLQTDSLVELFKQTTPPVFQTLLKLLRQTITANELFSAVDMHNVYQFITANTLDYTMYNIAFYETSQTGKYFDCYCDEYSMCQLPEGIYGNMIVYDFAGSNWINNINVNASTAGINATFLVPGMIAGCMSMESMLYSTLECLTDQTCLNQIGAYMNYSSIPINSFSVLNRSQLTRNLTVETLAKNLFVDQWIINKSFEKYFQQCQPLFCQYIDYQTNTFIHIIAAIIGLYGGLRTGLMFIIPLIVKFMRKKKKVQQRNIYINIPKSKL
jgi:hypothetical protein